tara:strand:- start:4851 stop:6014 length:1164 start_codon:yes stop_codon:yes gene_type:complete
MRKLISILGSTGSIGLTTLSIVDKKPKYFKPYIFSANKNYRLICLQIKKYKPTFFFIKNEKIFEKIKKKFKSNRTKIINNFDIKYFSNVSNITVLAIPGIAGLSPTLTMIKKSKKILIANKESIICGWNLINNYSSKYKTEIIPVDSEHYSILKLLQNTNLDSIEKVYLTASGGPFLGYKHDQLKKIKPQHALKHPKWKMGKKITIDSSTLMNKVLEYIEAQKLFKIPNNKLDILIHPESLVHAVIKFKNGLTKFIYHDTSMIVPIANAIFDNNLEIDRFYKVKKNIKNLTFKIPKKSNYPIIKILKKVNEYPSTSIIINASNEVLVDHFLRKKLPFLDIPLMIEKILRDINYKKYAIRNPKDLTQINKINSWAKIKTIQKIKAKYG